MLPSSSKEDSVKQAHGGIGASSHMSCLLFTAAIGAKPTLVAYRGSSPALNDLVGGHVDFLCEQSVSVADSVLAGTVKAYAVSASQRLAQLPDVPTAKEAGVNYEMSVWAGLFAPKGVPAEVVAKLADALDKALDEPSVRERLAQLGGSIPDKAERNPAAFDRFVRSENSALGAHPRHSLATEAITSAAGYDMVANRCRTWMIFGQQRHGAGNGSIVHLRSAEGALSLLGVGGRGQSCR